MKAQYKLKIFDADEARVYTLMGILLERRLIAESRFEKMNHYFFVNKSVVDVIKALQRGPVVTAHFVSKEFKFYQSGIYNGEGCGNLKENQVNHSSIIVGYNLRAKTPYFKVRNSWAGDWGENGYYRVAIGRLSRSNPGICLIAGTSFMIFVNVE